MNWRMVYGSSPRCHGDVTSGCAFQSAPVTISVWNGAQATNGEIWVVFLFFFFFFRKIFFLYFRERMGQCTPGFSVWIPRNLEKLVTLKLVWPTLKRQLEGRLGGSVT